MSDNTDTSNNINSQAEVIDTEDVELFEKLPIPKLTAKCVLPAMASVGFSAIYSIVDGIFVGEFVGEEALAAVNITMPLIMITTALTDMIASGSSVRISVMLGEKDEIGANHVFALCIALILGMSLLFGGTGYFLCNQLVLLLGAEGEAARCGSEYLKIFALFMPLCCLYYTLDNYLRDCGKQTMSMVINIVCSLLNILLDALFVVVFQWGLWGAGFASCLSMSIGALWSMIPFARKTVPLRFQFGKVPLEQILMIITNGSSDFFVSSAGSLLMVAENLVLLHFGGTLAVAASSIIEYAETLTEPLMFSISNSLQPAISYCYGAGCSDRMKNIQKSAMMCSAGVAIFAFVFLRFGGKLMLPLFVQEGNQELYDMTVHALTIYPFCYLFNWVSVSLSCYMTALEYPGRSLLISLLSTVVFPAICIFVFVSLFELDGFWAFWMVSAFLSAVCSVLIVRSAPQGSLFKA